MTLPLRYGTVGAELARGVMVETTIKRRVGVDLTLAEYDELEALADRQARPVTTLVRYWIREALRAERDQRQLVSVIVRDGGLS